MLLCSQRPGNIMAHAHHATALIVQAQNRRFVSPALSVQCGCLFLGVADAPGLFTVPQLKPGAQYGFLILAAVFSGLQRWHHTGFAVYPLALAIPRSKTVRTGAYNRLVVPAHACGSGQGRCTVIASYLGPALLSCHAEKRLVIPCLNRSAFLRLD